MQPLRHWKARGVTRNNKARIHCLVHYLVLVVAVGLHRQRIRFQIYMRIHSPLLFHLCIPCRLLQPTVPLPRLFFTWQIPQQLISTIRRAQKRKSSLWWIGSLKNEDLAWSLYMDSWAGIVAEAQLQCTTRRMRIMSTKILYPKVQQTSKPVVHFHMKSLSMSVQEQTFESISYFQRQTSWMQVHRNCEEFK